MTAAVRRTWKRSVLRVIGIPPGVGVLFDRESRVRLALALLGSVAVALVQVAAVAAVVPLIQLLMGASTSSGVLGRVSDFLGTSSPNRLALFLAGTILLGFALKALLSVSFRWWVLGTIARQEIATSTRVLRYYVRAPYALSQRRHTGELMRNMNEAVAQVYGQVVLGTISAATELITIVAMLLLLVGVAPTATAFLVVYFGLAALAYQRFAQPRLSRISEVTMESSVEVYRSSMQVLGGVKDLKLSGRDGHFIDEFRAARTKAAEARRSASFLSELPKHILELLFVLGVGLMTVYVFATQSTASAFSTVALFAAAGFRVLPSITACLASLNSVRAGEKALRLVQEDIEASVLFEDAAFSARRRTPLRVGIEVHDVWFRYEGTDVDVLRGINLAIPAGSSVALVGGSGAGKTTLVDVLLGLHRPTRGTVAADGEDITGRVHDWQAGIGLVPQNVYLSDGSLRENIAFGEYPERIDDARVRRAVDQAQLTDVVNALPGGVDARIGEAGSWLSGGQRQRIGIARALYQDPVVLFLDEATSALDNATEHRITQTIQALHGEVTMVIVAHRLSTVRHCDRVVYLADGHVAAAGTFDEVREASAEFAELVRLGDLSGARADGH